MRLTKALGLAAVAAVAAMAFVGTSTAFGQVDPEIVICKKLVTLCPANELWPAGSTLSFLAPGKGAEPPTLLGSLNVKCEDSVGTAVSTNEIGTTLPIEITELAFGKLPKPELGKECTNCTEVHIKLPILGQIEVAAEDKYFLKATGLARLLCPFIGECLFLGENIKVPILHTGLHPEDATGEKLPLIEFNAVPLPKESGPALCGSEGKWDADYVIYKVKSPAGVSGLGWPALDKKP